MTRGQILPFSEARRRKASNPESRWRAIADEFAGDVFPALHPSFRIKPGDTIFTIGSCFARNIERHLLAAGCTVPMLDFHMPASEWSGGVHGAMNRFHPPAFRQCLEWTAAIHDRDGRVDWADCQRLAFDWGDGRFFDMDMAATEPVSLERLIERRQHIYDIFSQVFSADCLMMTPGLIEAWRDRSTGLYLHEPPIQKAMLADRDRWEFEILSYEQCLADMLAAIDIVRTRNPDIKVMVTTSPVPLSATFSGQDIRVANTYSKSVLRAVCGAVTFQRPVVDYFPSFESATLSFPEHLWERDRIHVTSGFIGKIIRHMLDQYLEGGAEAALDYQAGLSAIMNSDFTASEAAARAVLKAQPGHVEGRALLAEALIRQGRSAEALDDLQALVEAYPERPELRISLARGLSRAGGRARATETISHIEAALQLPSASLASFRAVADVVRKLAPPETAERIMRQAVAFFPLQVEAYTLLSDVLIDQGRADEAIELLRKASTLRRARADLRVRLAGLLADARQTQECRDILAGVLATEPRNAGALALLAKIDAPPPAPEPEPSALDGVKARASWARILRPWATAPGVPPAK